MTPAERIAQLTAARAGGAITLPRRPVARAQTPHEDSSPVDPVAWRSLPETWRTVADDWQNRDSRGRAINIETRIAAWAVARCLGQDWHAEPTDMDNRNRINIIHRDGYGFGFGRTWNDIGRFRITPLRRYRRDEGPPAEITVAAARSFGAIAADIQRRMIDAGLKEAHDKDVHAEQVRRDELAARFAALSAVAKSCGGRFLRRQLWQSDGYPMLEIPGGSAAWSYGDCVRFEVDLTPEQAVEVGRVLRRIRSNGCDK